MSRLTSDRVFLLLAQSVSMLYSPMYLTVVAFVVVLAWSYLALLPAVLKVWLVLMVYAFTVLLPRLGIWIYRKLHGWTSHEMSRRERRYVPYVLSILCYASLWAVLRVWNIPTFATSLVVAALAVQVACALLNNFHKISTHAAASAAAVGVLMASAFRFAFNPVPWLCAAILLCGATCTARLYLRQHTLTDIALGVAAGFAAGFLCMF